jgi:hypothetical protein
MVFFDSNPSHRTQGICWAERLGILLDQCCGVGSWMVLFTPPAYMLGWVVGPFVGFAHGTIMASELLVLDGIHGG